MKVKIEDTCIACGLCADICPEVFEMTPEIARVIVDPVPAESEAATQQAIDACPVDSIVIV